MALRVTAILAGVALLPGLAWGGLPARSGIAEALQGRWGRAADRLPAASSERADRYFRARALVELGQTEDGLAILSELSGTVGPFGGPALEAALPLLFDAGRYGDVTSLFEKTRADRFQEDARLRYQTGQSYFLLRQYAKAQFQLKQVTAGPLLPYALYTLAQISQAEGRLLDAVELLGKAAEAAEKPGRDEVAAALVDRIRVTRGRMIYQAAVGQKNLSPEDRRKLFDLALGQLSRVGRGSLFYADALRTIGWCAAEIGDSAKALGAFEQASDADPAGRHEDLWAQGRVFQRLGYFDEAAKAYGEARKAAAQVAEETEEKDHGEAEANSWSALLDQAGKARGRLGAVAAEEGAVGVALDRKRKRIEESRGRLATLGATPKDYLAELTDLETNLEKYLDAASASALFPLAERPRLDAVLARQDRVLRELTTLEEVIVRLTGSSVWKGANVENRRVAQMLWQRLGKAKASLSRSQLAFLEGLKGRVSAREEELSRAIDSRRAEVGSVEPGRVRALRALDGEERRLSSVHERVEAVSARRRSASERLDALEAALRRARDGAITRAAAARATRLRLKADGYALDETEALQLWDEKGRGTGRGTGP